ncbi:hypothetical protein ACIBTP_39815 [Streptomyces avidinii]|uniref:hypothetical protein n=1 Tax=Streptomyces avidinii TaxID=1895 RepID=UPI00378C220D
MTDGLVRQCAVILPAIGIALTVQIRGIQRDLKARVDEVVRVKQLAEETDVKYGRYSAEGILISNTASAFRWWSIAGVLVYVYAALVVIGEASCLFWLAGANMKRFGSDGAEVLVGLTLAGLVGVLLIPAIRFMGDTFVIHPQRLNMAKERVRE